jgi:hypothetical protein
LAPGGAADIHPLRAANTVANRRAAKRRKAKGKLRIILCMSLLNFWQIKC